MKIYYFFDSLCGWCFGFNKPLQEFIQNHKELEFEPIAGGLFVGNRSLPISEYPHIPNANAKISEIFKVNFSDKYQKNLQKGEIILNSYHSAVAFESLKKFLPKEKHIFLIFAIQNAFFIEGESLSDIETYVKIAKNFGIKKEYFYEELAKNLSKKYENLPDFDKTREMQIQGFPTLILQKNGKFYDLRQSAITSEELENNFSKILKNF